jgi:hypothetical protein
MLLGVSLAGWRRPPSNTKIRLCKPLALGYWQTVPQGKWLDCFNSRGLHIQLPCVRDSAPSGYCYR